MLIRNSVILAAGASRRLGHPKALVEFGGITLVEKIASTLEKTGLSVTIVTRPSLETEIRNLIPNADIIVNPDPESGRTGSLQCALRKIGHFPIIMAPVDRPGFSTKTLELICQKDETVCPSRNGRGGHPIAISSSDVGKILKSPPNTSLRNIINPRRIEVNDQYLHLNIDTPEDYKLLIKVAENLL